MKKNIISYVWSKSIVGLLLCSLLIYPIQVSALGEETANQTDTVEESQSTTEAVSEQISEEEQVVREVCEDYFGLQVSFNDDGAHALTITGLKKSKIKSTLTVPKVITVDGVDYKVTAVGDGAFKNCTKLKKVTISSNVKRIGKEAFLGCKNVKTLKLVTKKLSNSTVGKNAFKGLSKKVTVQLPANKYSAYKSMLKKKGLSKQAKIKK